MPPELRAVIEDAYRVFGDYRIRHSLTVCHCNSCVSEEDERRRLKTPLREVPAKLLAEYTGSAHSWDDGPVARQMRYFLPRYFELIAADDPPDFDIDICLPGLPRPAGAPSGRTRKVDDRRLQGLLSDAVELG